jgi:hypothetical protein
MTSILQLFSNETANKSITDSASNYKKEKIDLYSPTPALSQGTKFKKYQNKITKNLEKKINYVNAKEGFSKRGENATSLTAESNAIINDNNYSAYEQNVNNLRQNYKSTIDLYNTAEQNLKDATTAYNNRTNPNNPYLGQNVCLNNGAGGCGYVTHKGVFKWYPADNNYTYNSTAGKNNCPSTPWINTPGNGNVYVPGSVINSDPPLIVGTPMVAGQSCGFEDEFVFVDKLIDENLVKPEYQGCYADNPNRHVVNFIGGSPPLPTVIENGNFDQPDIGNNNYIYMGWWSIWYVRKPVGWTFYAVLANNSSAWGFPMPYPYGNQCAVIQETQWIRQDGIYLQVGVQYTLTFVACGRNCCDGSGESNPIKILLNQIILDTIQPPVNVWTNYSIPFTVSTSQFSTLMFEGTWSTSDRSTAFQNIKIEVGSGGSGGPYTYEDCKQAAIQNEYQYFGLQNVNPETSKGYCAVSNSEPTASSLGESYVASAQKSLWSSNTQGQTGNTSILTAQGALSVLSSDGKSVFTTDNSKATPGNYIGCYNDCYQGRGLPNAITIGTNAGSTYDTCSQAARDGGWAYFGLQFTQPSGTSECWVGNDLNAARSMGKASNCTTANNVPVGGSCSNAVYDTNNPQSVYFLILQDDGNMCIYRGSGPNDNQGTIFCTMTNGQQNAANPAYAAAKGKYGQNWISSGSTLAAGDFVGSTNGNLALIMQTDGNLVLYTFDEALNCKQMKDGNTGGGANANAIYNIGEVGIQGNLGKIGYVDENTNLHYVNSNNTKYGNIYSQIENNNTPYNDLPNAVYGGATVDQCKTSCNNLDNCAGFVFDKTNNICWPKTNGMYPYGGPINVDNNDDIYIRNKVPSTFPLGTSGTTNSIDSVIYQHFPSGGRLGGEYGLPLATQSQRRQLRQVEGEMGSYANQLTDYTNKFSMGSAKAQHQTKKNVIGLDNYVTDLNTTQDKIKGIDTNIDNILNDSDITVLQLNYDYLFWTIIATGIVLVTMNLTKK